MKIKYLHCPLRHMINQNIFWLVSIPIQCCLSLSIYDGRAQFVELFGAL